MLCMSRELTSGVYLYKRYILVLGIVDLLPCIPNLFLDFRVLYIKILTRITLVSNPGPPLLG